MAKKADTQARMGFEESMDRLETIVAEMEGGRLNLEDMIVRFEEGQRLIKFCAAKLDEVEKKIEVLVKKEDGTVMTEPLDAETGEGEGDEEEDEEEESNQPGTSGYR